MTRPIRYCQHPGCLKPAAVELLMLDVGRLFACVEHQHLNLKDFLEEKEKWRRKSSP